MDYLDLDAIKDIPLTVAETVVTKNALRMYTKQLCKYIQDALDVNDYAAAMVHTTTLRETIEIFGKMI